MKISLSTKITKNELLVAFVPEKQAAPCGLPKYQNLVQQASQQGFKGKENTTALVQTRNGSPAALVVLVGLGDRTKITTEKLRRAAAAGTKRAQSLSQKAVHVLLPDVLGDAKKETLAISEGTLLGAYKFDKYKTPDKDSVKIKNVTLVAAQNLETEVKKGLRLAQILSDAACFVRDLVNEPPSNLTPAKVAEAASEIAEKGKSSGITVQIFGKEKIEELKMGALLGVNRGSAEPPVFIHLHYKPDQQPGQKLKSVALVGKGITFDSGGLSLKPSQSMETMKMDMAGAGSILGVFKAIPALKPKVEVHGILAVTENMPGGKACKPGDVFIAMNGKSIEVLNTDAEGRLILSDALAYAARQNPDAIIDVATLTGACITALGSLVSGVMGNSQELLDDLEKASQESGERFWELPLVEEYKDGLKSPIADIKNISSARGEAGSIIGGLFLQDFVDGKPWIHMDIAGPAWSDKEFHYYSQGGTGVPTRTLVHYLLNQTK